MVKIKVIKTDFWLSKQLYFDKLNLYDKGEYYEAIKSINHDFFSLVKQPASCKDILVSALFFEIGYPRAACWIIVLAVASSRPNHSIMCQSEG